MQERPRIWIIEQKPQFSMTLLGPWCHYSGSLNRWQTSNISSFCRFMWFFLRHRQPQSRDINNNLGKQVHKRKQRTDTTSSMSPSQGDSKGYFQQCRNCAAAETSCFISPQSGMQRQVSFPLVAGLPRLGFSQGNRQEYLSLPPPFTHFSSLAVLITWFLNSLIFEKQTESNKNLH